MADIKKRDCDKLKDEIKRRPAEADAMVRVIDINAWIALLTLAAIVAGGLVWGFFGTMFLHEEVSGVIVRSGKIINIHAAHDCRLVDLNITSQEYAEKGQVIARTEQAELASEINRMIARGAPATEIKMKRAELIKKSQIATPDAGRIVDVFARAGDFVKKGDVIATISREARDDVALECYLFVPANKVKNIRKNMRVNVYPANVNRDTYGNMTGIVSKVSEFPVTENYLFDILGSRELAQEFLKDGACYEVYITLDTSEETISGYAWTTSFGPPIKFGDITLSDAAVVIEKMRPIDLLFLRN